MSKGIIAKIAKVQEITNADKIHVAFVMGESVVVSKDWGVGTVGLFFPEGTQLSEDFCKENNLYRDATKNVDVNKKGFFEDNRRVRAQPFLKQRSEGLFVSLPCLNYTGTKIESLKVGDSFDKTNGHVICCKYISEKTRKAMKGVQKKKTATNSAPMFNKHSDTAQFRHSVQSIPTGALLGFHGKVHGTSARMSYSKVTKTLPRWKQLVNKVLPIFQTEFWEHLVGTRNVVLFEDQYKDGDHGADQYRFDVMDEIKHHLVKGMTVYGEIAGYANGSPIMGTHDTTALKDKKFNKKYGKTVTYSYGCKEHEHRFHVYRISITTEDGLEQDFTASQVEDWCLSRGILSHMNVHKPFIYNGDQQSLINLVEGLTERKDVLTEDFIDTSHVSEGIVIRVDHGTNVPKFYKSKSYAFKVLEGIWKEDNVDTEDAA